MPSPGCCTSRRGAAQDTPSECWLRPPASSVSRKGRAPRDGTGRSRTMVVIEGQTAIRSRNLPSRRHLIRNWARRAPESCSKGQSSFLKHARRGAGWDGGRDMRLVPTSTKSRYSRDDLLRCNAPMNQRARYRRRERCGARCCAETTCSLGPCRAALTKDGKALHNIVHYLS